MHGAYNRGQVPPGDPPVSSTAIGFHQSPPQRLPARRSFGPCRDRILVTAFRSPATAAPLSASIPGSTFPACHFVSRSALRQPGPPLAPLPPLVSPSPGCFNARNPLPASCRPLPAFQRAATPLRDVAIPRDQCACPRPADRPTLESARFPLAPRCRLLLRLPATDHRSWFATFPSGLLFPRPALGAAWAAGFPTPFSTASGVIGLIAGPSSAFAATGF
jgi:hypothetical protein